jgi:hypothetical protein
MNSDLAKGTVFTRLREFLVKLKMEYNTEFQVAFYTSLGRIVCDIEPPAHASSIIGVTDDPTMFTVDISAFFDEKDVFGAQLINAKNVIVYKNNTDEELMRTEQMVLFADQILGFTLVKKQI